MFKTVIVLGVEDKGNGGIVTEDQRTIKHAS